MGHIYLHIMNNTIMYVAKIAGSILARNELNCIQNAKYWLIMDRGRKKKVGLLLIETLFKASFI